MSFKKPKFWDYNRITVCVVILFPLTLVYRFIYWIIKISKPLKKFPIPIICIGNIYVGGTGKTPLTKEIFNIIKSLNKNPAIVKKHYSYLQDEISMLEKIGKIYTSKKRSESIAILIKDNHDVAIMDDGFQDFSIKPDFSILCFNSKQLIGNGFTIPSGPLRESFSSIKRADCIFINGKKNLEFEKKIRKINSEIKIFYTFYKPKNLDRFKNKKVVAFAGIGNPQNFFDLLKENNIHAEKEISFPDHHNYTKNDYHKIINSNNKDTSFVTTEKDYYRLDNEIKKKFDYINIDLEIINKDEFINLIKNKL